MCIVGVCLFLCKIFKWRFIKLIIMMFFDFFVVNLYSIRIYIFILLYVILDVIKSFFCLI